MGKTPFLCCQVGTINIFSLISVGATSTNHKVEGGCEKAGKEGRSSTMQSNCNIIKSMLSRGRLDLLFMFENF